jgi:hypothetical protein
MHWQDTHINKNRLYAGYEKKYGLRSDYQRAQKILYSQPLINAGLVRSLNWIKLSPDDCVLEIGINNGYELKFIRRRFGKKLFSKLSIIGFDLAEDVLKIAAKNNWAFKNIQFIKGNVFSFRGKNVVSGKSLTIANGAIDAVIALTSFQSTSLLATVDSFIKKLNRKLKAEAQLLIAIPNCYVDDRFRVVRGLWDETRRKADRVLARKYAQKITNEFIRLGFQVKKIESDFIFLYYWRVEVDK